MLRVGDAVVNSWTSVGWLMFSSEPARFSLLLLLQGLADDWDKRAQTHSGIVPLPCTSPDDYDGQLVHHPTEKKLKTIGRTEVGDTAGSLCTARARESVHSPSVLKVFGHRKLWAGRANQLWLQLEVLELTRLCGRGDKVYQSLPVYVSRGTHLLYSPTASSYPSCSPCSPSWQCIWTSEENGAVL